MTVTVSRTGTTEERRWARRTGGRRRPAGYGWAAVAVALPLLAAAPAVAAPPPERAADQLYVATWGKDSWPGSATRPFATLERARDAVRARTAHMSSDLVVNVRGGTYRLTAPLRLSAADGDSGTGGHRVVYQAYGYGTGSPERVTVSGGRTVDGWTPAGPADDDVLGATTGVWRTDVGDLDTRQLYVDGRRAARTTLGDGLPGHVRRTATGYVTDSTVPRSWKRPEDLEFVYLGAEGALPYSEARCGVAGISGDARSTTVTMDQPCFQRLAELYKGEPEEPSEPVDPTDVENSGSFLPRRAGSWYLDRSRAGHHVLYYRPRPGEDPRAVRAVAPVLQSLVSGTGTADAPLHDVALRGLTFADATWLGPSLPSGFPHIIGNWYLDGGDGAKVPGAVSFRTAARITVEGNRFTRLGGQGLELSRGANDHVVRDNELDDLSGGGVLISGDGGARPSGGSRIEGNRVHDVGIDYRGGMGIVVEYSRDTTVAHNDVGHIPYSGIWGEADGGLRIVDNHVHHTVGVVPDGGGIYLPYAQGPTFEKGAVVSGNVVHDTGAKREWGAPAVYTDVGADHVTVRGNVLYRNGTDLGGVEPKHVRFHDNFWDDDRPVWWPEGTYDDVVIGHNTLLAALDPSGACRADATCRAIRDAAGAGKS